MEKFMKLVTDKIEKEAVFLNGISKQIWSNPELKFEEEQAHDLLTGVLKEKGFSVQPHYILPTAFRAEFNTGGSGITIAVLCEYDALPIVGHACGHNLIAEAGLGAGLAIKAALEADNTVYGKVVVLGTPAEEGGGGKIALIDGGAFKDIDVALMVHPSPDDHLYAPFIACDRLTVTYTGREAHACGFPWEGLNALDAAVAAYSNVALLRQHLKPTSKIHGVITNGGAAPNIIPGSTELKYMFRAGSTKDLNDLRKRVETCFISAANATGCKVDMKYEIGRYDSLISNKVLCETYRKYAEKMGVVFQDGNPKVIPFMASTDMGNVSHVVPSIHPTYSIGTRAPNHSVGFTEASGTAEAQHTTLITIQAMALVALELMINPKLVDDVKRQFEVDIAEDAE